MLLSIPIQPWILFLKTTHENVRMAAAMDPALDNNAGIDQPSSGFSTDPALDTIPAIDAACNTDPASDTYPAKNTGLDTVPAKDPALNTNSVLDTNTAKDPAMDSGPDIIQTIDPALDNEASWLIPTQKWIQYAAGRN
ncbi:Hypothetical protein NTJ_06718 [Nesidiocoris tenuis]|uniref:Uncharacterized protein n=1 Tax=Nesidiocoris tenuis TaxID=355587 RepID=A0ABN7ANV3_9HEMI|nr:Hypothetical protein NTJ_06718 [Nesidiocoris tenuis]